MWADQEQQMKSPATAATGQRSEGCDSSGDCIAMIRPEITRRRRRRRRRKAKTRRRCIRWQAKAVEVDGGGPVSNQWQTKQMRISSQRSIVSSLIIVLLTLDSCLRASFNSLAADAQTVAKLQDFAATSSGLWAEGHSTAAANEMEPNSRLKMQRFEPKVSSLNEFLETLPTLSVGLKHSASFECELDAESAKFKLIWLRLINGTTAPDEPRPSVAAKGDQNDISLLSLDKRLITPDRRFKVSHRPPSRWTLTIDNVGQADDRAYYLCQASGTGDQKQPDQQQQQPSGKSGDYGAGSAGARFIGGARLNVLVPPKIVEHETSPSLVGAAEFEPLRLRCKVSGEPQSQVSWRREDGRPLDGLEQTFRHQLERRPGQLVSIDSSELVFDSLRRNQSGAYLCIASNGILSGVSQRINVALEGCRSAPGPAGSPEPCDQHRPPPSESTELAGSTPQPQPQPPMTTTMMHNQRQLGRPGEQPMEAADDRQRNSSQKAKQSQPAAGQVGRRNNWKLGASTAPIGPAGRRNSTAESRRRAQNNATNLDRQQANSDGASNGSESYLATRMEFNNYFSSLLFVVLLLFMSS